MSDRHEAPRKQRKSEPQLPVEPYHVLFTSAEFHIETRCYPDSSTRTVDTLTGESVSHPLIEPHVLFTSANLHIEARRYPDGSTKTVDTLTGKFLPAPTIRDCRPLAAVRSKIARGASPTGPDPLTGWLVTLDRPAWYALAERWRARWQSDLESLSTGAMSAEQRGWIIDRLNESS